MLDSVGIMVSRLTELVLEIDVLALIVSYSYRALAYASRLLHIGQPLVRYIPLLRGRPRPFEIGFPVNLANSDFLTHGLIWFSI